jgi:hypothetical protein
MCPLVQSSSTHFLNETKHIRKGQREVNMHFSSKQTVSLDMVAISIVSSKVLSSCACTSEIIAPLHAGKFSDGRTPSLPNMFHSSAG